MSKTRFQSLFRGHVPRLYELLYGGFIYELDHVPGFGGQEGLDQLPDGGEDPGHVVHHDLGHEVRVVVHHGVDQKLYCLYFHISENLSSYNFTMVCHVQLGQTLNSKVPLQSSVLVGPVC